ncbi:MULTISPECIES: methyltransferase domain-containing protein [unclassified Variovorax]|uniref:class I SAM-dependent methyltransferase n=1 Tax=unclassified Variovorax TaxID=663243 RepID=UPI00076DF131|nr:MULTISPECIES: methyltransferase domain-containing protein [unclassified Variovorax]KWT72175.1 UbiE/COQ5 methyltransferase [Variovorax sp. WDL1]PNG58886.1 Ubiquinone/menaquinone biosynthesis C-methyltransferase UbiE [Variovorax sp. B4]PNG61324.1 Ubiquinone/menaquinone biosynthesis C-methyltransferase UbiE [Variovorax sp. B2]VTV12683.1 Ubiquinone/menaquinone biosynthesis methyltransferase ubiE [Variovorax sp. WDL1]
MTDAVASAWDRAAEGWSRNTPAVHAWLRQATAAMLAQARLQAGARVLDLAAGAGDQTRDIAQAVGPTGAVLATDISPKILDFARRNIEEAGLTNVRFAVADAQQPVHEQASFDAVMCRLGLMLCMNPAAALAAAFDALRPGGRYVALVFGDPANNPCIATMMKVARKHRGLEGSNSPYVDGGLFSLAAPGRLASLLIEAGYAEVTVESIAAPFELPDAAAYVDFVRSSGSPIIEILAPLDAPAREAAWRDIEEALQRFGSPSGWCGPNELLLGSATRPA